MITSNLKIIAILAGICVGVIVWLQSRRRLIRYWTRTCTGTEWRKQFPHASKDSIRDFLECFVDGFAFSRKKQLKFSPDDKIMDVYRALYPYKGWPDALELETFSLYLEEKYRLDLVSVFTDDLTLGQVFKMATKQIPA